MLGKSRSKIKLANSQQNKFQHHANLTFGMISTVRRFFLGLKATSPRRLLFSWWKCFRNKPGFCTWQTSPCSFSQLKDWWCLLGCFSPPNSSDGQDYYKFLTAQCHNTSIYREGGSIPKVKYTPSAAADSLTLPFAKWPIWQLTFTRAPASRKLRRRSKVSPSCSAHSSTQPSFTSWWNGGWTF